MKTPGWEERLAAWAEARVGSPFKWGRTDCALLAAEAFDVMAGGSDLLFAYAGRWDSARSALRFQRKFALDLRAVLVQSGCKEVDVRLARNGDIVTAPRMGFQCGHVVVGARAVSAWLGRDVHWSSPGLLRIPGAVALRMG